MIPGGGLQTWPEEWERELLEELEAECGPRRRGAELAPHERDFGAVEPFSAAPASTGSRDDLRELADALGLPTRMQALRALTGAQQSFRRAWRREMEGR